MAYEKIGVTLVRRWAGVSGSRVSEGGGYVRRQRLRTNGKGIAEDMRVSLGGRRLCAVARSSLPELFAARRRHRINNTIVEAVAT